MSYTKTICTYILLAFAVYTALATSVYQGEIKPGMYSIMSDCPDADIKSGQITLNGDEQDAEILKDFGLPADMGDSSGKGFNTIEDDTRTCNFLKTDNKVTMYVCRNKQTNIVECTVILTEL